MTKEEAVRVFRVGRLRLLPKDLLVIKSNKRLTPQQQNEITGIARTALDAAGLKNKVVVLDDRLSVSTIGDKTREYYKKQ
jgi:hypothetical protein